MPYPAITAKHARSHLIQAQLARLHVQDLTKFASN
nr:unnamed protein product [Callosobruchus chinensis]